MDEPRNGIKGGPYVVGIGAANLDIMGRSRETVVMEDSNPGFVGVSVGGVTHNICENAARLGAAVKFISATGDDFQGRTIREACRDAGLDISHFMTVPGHASSTYLSIHDRDGEMTVALSDMRVLQRLTVEFLEERREVLEGAAAIVMDCGLPQEVLDHVARAYGDRVPVFVDPVSTAYARKLLGELRGFHTIKPNRLEAQVLAGMEISSQASLEEACRRILARGARRVVVSLGREGVFAMEEGGAAHRMPAFPLEEVVNATGAGDCFMGALVFAHVSGMAPEEALAFATCASALALSHRATINPHITQRAVLAVLDRFPYYTDRKGSNER